MEHMQAVKTIWKLEFTGTNGIFRRVIVENASEIPTVLKNIKASGASTANMIETRTCGAMPGLAYTQEETIIL